MITVKYVKEVESPDYLVGKPGDVRELYDSYARQLINGGYAVEVDNTSSTETVDDG